MTVTPVTLGIFPAQVWPMFRIFVRPPVKQGAQNGAWQLLPSPGRYVTFQRATYEIVRLSRCVIPQIGEAVFRFRFGVIDKQIVGGSSDNADGSSGFSPGNLNDLRDYEVIIQAAPTPSATAFQNGAWNASAQNVTATWCTIWHGWCTHQVDKIYPASAGNLLNSTAPGQELMGERLYHCFDQHSRVKKWPLTHHAGFVNGTAYTGGLGCEGHPGYNATDPDGHKLGNLDSTGATFDPNGDLSGDNLAACRSFCFSGAGLAWTDQNAVEHALNTARGKGDRKLLMCIGTSPGSVPLFNLGTNVWKVNPDASAGDIVDNICRRQRGRGIAFYDWSADYQTTGSSLTDISMVLRVSPQILNDVTYNDPTASGVTIQGATNAGRTTTVTLSGDHRNIAKSFFIGSRDEHRVDYLESLSTEKIQVLATFSYTKNLDIRWSATDANAFNALDVQHRIDGTWDHVYQLHGISKAWLGLADDGAGSGGATNSTGGTQSRCDYRCDDTGAITQPDQFVSATDTPPYMCKLLPTVPIYEGYDYSGSTPVRKDGAAETQSPTRRQPLILMRVGVGEFVDARIYPGLGVELCVRNQEFRVRVPSDGGFRTIGDPAASGSNYKYDQLVWAGAIELPHRPRMATGDPNGSRKMRIFHRNLHLWIAHPLAIWNLRGAGMNTDLSYPAQSGACASSTPFPGILRDDRSTLALLHNLAVSWYGPTSAANPERRVARWSLKCCGFLSENGTSVDATTGAAQPNFYTDTSGTGTGTLTSQAYPTLGQFITTINAGGVDWPVNTPVTSISYDNESGVTTWCTDWNDLDFEGQ